MTVQGRIGRYVTGMTLALAVCAATSASAQTAVSSADIQRLQDEVYQASADVSRLRTSDALQAGRLQDELDNLREDVIYLKVKLRKENAVSRAEYAQVRDQLTDLRARARGDVSCTGSVEQRERRPKRRDGRWVLRIGANLRR